MVNSAKCRLSWEMAEEGGWVCGDRWTMWVRRPTRILPMGGPGDTCYHCRLSGMWGRGPAAGEGQGRARVSPTGAGKGRKDSPVLWVLGVLHVPRGLAACHGATLTSLCLVL